MCMCVFVWVCMYVCMCVYVCMYVCITGIFYLAFHCFAINPFQWVKVISTSEFTVVSL